MYTDTFRLCIRFSIKIRSVAVAITKLFVLFFCLSRHCSSVKRTGVRIILLFVQLKLTEYLSMFLIGFAAVL